MSLSSSSKKLCLLALILLPAVSPLAILTEATHNDAEHLARHTSLSKRKITQQDRTFYKYVTRPDIDAPVFHVDVHDEHAVAPGYWFVAPYGQLGQDRPGPQWDGPHIYDGKGELVWSGTPMFGYWNVFDFESRMVDGERMLTLLSDHEKHGFILDSSYEVYKTVPLLVDQAVKPNMHEFNVFENGTRALLLTHVDGLTPKEQSQVVGYDGPCDAKYQGFREMDVDSVGAEEVLFEWDASHHIGLDEATYKKYDGSVDQQCARGWDILHLNSITKFPDGDYLLSARHTDALYKISHKDGSIVWRLGGVKSDFIQDDWKFSRQHHAQVLSQNETHTTLSVFDNGIGDGPFEKATSKKARALVMLLDTAEMKAEIVREYRQPGGERTNARGSFQILPNGNAFICWAYHSYMTEHAPDGSVVMEARIPIKLRSYRAFKHPWVGSPSRPPDVHAEAVAVDDHLVTVIHVSWNGDTRTRKWEFSEVDEGGDVKHLGSVRRQGFETSFEYKALARRVFAEAFDGDGTSLGKSGVTTTVRSSPLIDGGSDSQISEEGYAAPPEKGVDQDEEPQPSRSWPSDFQQAGTTFIVGAVCGIAAAALGWTAVRVYQRRWDRVVQRGSDAKYRPLQDDDPDD
ncbi:uncharacterized protein LTR77_001128 [Saxophila tyrrhenica]|uniref:ASST-domain-containing protein n=1 Tax=Saxophila tyrrhenica TaxID=1690608 RepID=A0AAV9PJ94_9PEZI|nr:hypothetical protein LTR77_001128 [Saxophila tyrrhenica]